MLQIIRKLGYMVQVPPKEIIEAVEAEYRFIFEALGETIEFPRAYPTGVLLGTVDVVDCLPGRMVESWDGLPEPLKLEVG